MNSAIEVFEVGCVVVGAGVVGLAVARELALAGHDVFVLEKNSAVSMETSSRNSEVIHAGIYYPKHSLKAKACVLGKRRLYNYLKERRIAHKQCGKLIVATTPEEIETLHELKENASMNGVSDLHMLSRTDVRKLEPELSVDAAMFSPSSGIFDTHSFAQSLLADLQNSGAKLVLNTNVLKGYVQVNGYTRLYCEADAPFWLSTRLFVNCAGLHAHDLASRIEGFPENRIPKVAYAKGTYFGLSGRNPFSTLIYPVPVNGGLGIHLTIDLGGMARFGPDVEWVSDIDYSVDANNLLAFYDAIRSYWPSLEYGRLVPAYSGIRPKISTSSENSADFVTLGPDDHNVPGQVHMFGIESPGLTASFELARRVSMLCA